MGRASWVGERRLVLLRSGSVLQIETRGELGQVAVPGIVLRVLSVQGPDADCHHDCGGGQLEGTQVLEEAGAGGGRRNLARRRSLASRSSRLMIRISEWFRACEELYRGADLGHRGRCLVAREYPPFVAGGGRSSQEVAAPHSAFRVPHLRGPGGIEQRSIGKGPGTSPKERAILHSKCKFARFCHCS